MQFLFVWISLLLAIWMKGSLAQRTQNKFPNRASCGNEDFIMTPSVNRLAFNLAKQIGGSGNNFFSPLGIAMSLGTSYMGAGGNTSNQMEEALGYKELGVSGGKVHYGIRDLCEEIVGSSKQSEHTIMIANGFFSQTNLETMSNFTSGLESFYHAEQKYVDFKNAEDALQQINRWARTKTMGKVKGILNKPLPLSTKMVITNAIYFKGTWKVQFSVHRTYNNYFYVAGKEPKIVPMMMMLEESFRYLKDLQTGYKYLDLPYKGNRVSMLFALPLDHDQPADLQLDNDLFCRLRSEMRNTKLDVIGIPKFKLEYERNLKNDLVNMGMINAFSPGLADFSGIRKDSSIYISDVLHKAVIEVNEEGSEAAAVTGQVFRPVSFREVPEFIANHPFLFYIVDHGTGTILFSGKVDNP